jgi:anti-sigma regulatory factor (Ser/Thr protein kinase)
MPTLVTGVFVNEESCVPHELLDLSFAAEPEAVADLRRVMRQRLGLAGLYDVVDEAQLCVSELVANVIRHVGPGTPATLVVSRAGTRLRIEVRDPDARVLPTLVSPDSDAESGRGMALVDAIAAGWGVHFYGDKKGTWCELATGGTLPDALEASGVPTAWSV